MANIALMEGEICIFDALEFEPRLRWIDVMSEVAFLVMDLERHDRSDLAYGFLNRYLEVTGDYEGMTVFRFYEVYRALVRAKVAGIRIGQISKTDPEWSESYEEWVGYLRLAIRLSRGGRPAVLFTHGVSGTGKTTVSSKILQAVGAIRVRSDVERQRLNRAESAEIQGPSDAYSLTMTQATYDRLAWVADRMVSAGFPVIVDATFLRKADRLVFAQLAQRHQVLFRIMDIMAPQTICSQRIEQRLAESRDASEATVSVMQRQIEQDEPFGNDEQPVVMAIDSTSEDSMHTAIRRLSQLLSSGD